MSDMATVRQLVIEQWKLDRSGADDEFVNQSICQALVSLRPMPLTFNVGTFSMDTIADQANYAKATKGGATANLLPWDFWGVIGSQLRVDEEKGGDPNSYYRLKETDPGALDREAWNTTQSDRPTQYTIWSEQLWLNPPPDSIDEISGRYLQDLDTPVPIYASSTWNYVGSDGSNINKSTFTNAWFTRAFDVLVAKAAMHYFGRHERNVKNQNAAGTAYAIALAELKKEAAPLVTTGQIKPSMGNM